jgi:anti-anti-sigma factor
MSLDIEIFDTGNGRTQIQLRGRLDTHTSGNLEACLSELSAPQYPLQILDMENLDYISSAGLRCIFKAKKTLVAAGGRLLLVNIQPAVKKVLDIIKALPADEVFANPAEMNAYLDKLSNKSCLDN